MFTSVKSMGILGMDSYMVDVEVDLSSGLPRFDIVGLPDSAINEAKNRVRPAMQNNGFRFPVSRITVNLAPADVRKVGSVYDLPILVGILLAGGEIADVPQDTAFLGELSLGGQVQRVNGALPMVIQAKQAGLSRVFVPIENAAESSVVDGITVYPVAHIRQLVAHLTGGTPIAPADAAAYQQKQPVPTLPDFADIKGQLEARRAMEIAAAGGHNILMVGPPGSGKSMLAKRLPSILPDMTFAESLETTKLYSIAGVLGANEQLMQARPFRAPHHSVSVAGLVGGGIGIPRPGEVSLSHNGVLFLDELPEFQRNALEVLRQPMEDGTVTISRVGASLTYPCSAMVVCAMNPCPCGYYGHPTKACTCSTASISRYMGRVSGPLLDRMDMHIAVPAVEFAHLADDTPSENSASIRERVNRARAIQAKRLADSAVSCNARMDAHQTRTLCKPTQAAVALLGQAFEKMGLSARAYDKVLRVARTIADLEDSAAIEVPHVAQAVQFRSLDRHLL